MNTYAFIQLLIVIRLELVVPERTPCAVGLNLAIVASGLDLDVRTVGRMTFATVYAVGSVRARLTRRRSLVLGDVLPIAVHTSLPMVVPVVILPAPSTGGGALAYLDSVPPSLALPTPR